METKGTLQKTAFLLLFLLLLLGLTALPYTCLIEQIMYVLLVKVKGLMTSLESSSAIDNTWDMTGRGHHERFPRSLTHRDPWLRAELTYGEHLKACICSWITEKIPHRTTILNKNPSPKQRMRLTLLSFRRLLDALSVPTLSLDL